MVKHTFQTITQWEYDTTTKTSNVLLQDTIPINGTRQCHVPSNIIAEIVTEEFL